VPTGLLGTVRWSRREAGFRGLGRVVGGWAASLWKLPLVVALTLVVVHGLWLAALIRSGNTPESFIHIGHLFVSQGHGSPAIDAGAAHYQYSGEIGFDGQFFFYIAVDPLHASGYLDFPAYRYSRIAYPLTAGAVALFRPAVVPWTLLLVNLAMIGVGVLALAAWLRDRGASPWLAAIYGLFPGIPIGFQRDTSEIMSYSLVAVAVYLTSRIQRGRVLFAGAAFGLAVLTRETALLFAIPYAAGQLVDGDGPWRERVRANRRGAAVLLALSLGPFLLLKLVLLIRLRSLGLAPLLTPIPFGGLFYLWPWQSSIVDAVRVLAVPAVLCGGAAVWALASRKLRVEVWAMLLNALLLVFMGAGSWADFSSSGRIAIGLGLSAVLCAPLIARRGWFWASAALWLSMTLAWTLPLADHYLPKISAHLHI
jgi:hypothetical protein